VQVDLAPNPTVGTHRPHDAIGRGDHLASETLPGDHFEDGVGGTDANALAAPGATGVIGITIAAHDDLGVRPALTDVQHAHFLDLVARPHATGAEDAERHVMLNHHVAGTFIPFAGAQRAVARD